MNSSRIPKLVWWTALLVIFAQVGVVAIHLAGGLHGYQRNIVFQVLIGGTIAHFVLAAYILRFCPQRVRFGPKRVGIILLTLLALTLTGLYFQSVRPLLALPYDLASWSEPEFLVDILKWRTGEKLYLPPEDSNSNTYTFAAPAITYFLAWVLGHPTSIPLYRWLQQLYLVLAALLASAATWNLVRLARPESTSKISRLWLVFFALASFLLAVNPQTGAYNVFLHNDPMTLLLSTLSFWLLTNHAASGNPRWLWAMAVMPALGFLVKQYLAIWAAVYVIYLWLDGSYLLRRVLTFGAVCFAGLGVTVGVCIAVWGDPFRYWVFEQLGTVVVSLTFMTHRIADATIYLLLGLFGGYVLLRGTSRERLLGLWAGWVVMVLMGIYTSGVTFSPTHLGPATVVGGCFALAAMVILWPHEGSTTSSNAEQWFHVGLGIVCTAIYFSGFLYLRPTPYQVSPDLSRYVWEIEREFEGLPVERVLLDMGDWIYLRHDVLMKDRAPIVLAQTTHLLPARRGYPHYGLLERVRNQEYDRILVHSMSSADLAALEIDAAAGVYLYDIGLTHGAIKKELLAHYREVRRIPGVRDMRNWRHYVLMMTDISVLEPIPRSQADARESTTSGDRANQ